MKAQPQHDRSKIIPFNVVIGFLHVQLESTSPQIFGSLALHKVQTLKS
jgi:hypothetical protein